MRHLAAITLFFVLSIPAQAQYNAHQWYMHETSRQLQYQEWHLYSQQPYWQGYYAAPVYYRTYYYPTNFNYYWGW